MAGDKGWEKKNNQPGQVENQGDTNQNGNPTQIERIPGERENTGGNDFERGLPRISGLTIFAQLAPRLRYEYPAQDQESDPYGDENQREMPARKRERYQQLQCDSYEERYAKDDLENLPPCLMCSLICHLTNRCAGATAVPLAEFPL